MIATTTRDTTHGEPFRGITLPAGTRVRLAAANNLPADSDIKYWAKPVQGHKWPKGLGGISDTIGVGLSEEDVNILHQ